MKRLIVLLLLLATFSSGLAEDKVLLRVTATQLNGRARPSTKSKVEAFWDYWDYVEATGKWSNDKEWIEVKGGECGTVWCSAKYLTEISDPIKAKNTDYKSIKIRSRPENGKVIGYLKKNKTVTITQVVLGWGKCRKGWIDMNLLTEIETDNKE